MSTMVKKTVEITIADHAEEALALNQFYQQRTLGVQAMRRTEAEKVRVLTEQLETAEKALSEAMAEIERLAPAKPVEAPEKPKRAN